MGAFRIGLAGLQRGKGRSDCYLAASCCPSLMESALEEQTFEIVGSCFESRWLLNDCVSYLLCDWRELESESEEVPIAIEDANGLCCGLGVLVNVDGACDGACELGGVS
jgi:hypothetical protein